MTSLAFLSNSVLARRYPVKKVNGIPLLQTISVTTSGSIVTYKVCPWRFRQLCNEGLLLLRITQIPSAGAGSAAFTVSLETSSQEGSTGIPLVNSIGENVTSNQVVSGNVLLIYYNKCQGKFQIINY